MFFPAVFLALLWVGVMKHPRYRDTGQEALTALFIFLFVWSFLEILSTFVTEILMPLLN